ncbi:MAG: Leucinerich repeat-containing protein, partial [Pseudomonas sp.]|nr:Leucinerich repeat-containing protein [Pseudomonas sp.]
MESSPSTFHNGHVHNGTVHNDFLKTRVPDWFVYSTAELRTRLKRDMVRGQHMRTQINTALADLQGLHEFARPLLSKALDAEFGPGLDVDKDYFSHIHYTYTFLTGRASVAGSTVQSLLQAALQNFHEEELAATHDSLSAIYQGEPNFYSVVDGSVRVHPLKVNPLKFMALCRKLDLGGKYQAHLDSFLGPIDKPAPNKPVPNRPLSPAQFKTLVMDKQRNVLQVEAHIACMGEMISYPDYRMLLSLPGTGETLSSTGKPLEVFTLKVLQTTVRDVLVFREQGQKQCVVYMPGEPTSPLISYDSFEDDFIKSLRAKLRSPDYLQYFARFIPERSRAAFFSKLRERLTPHRVHSVQRGTGWHQQLIAIPEVDENANIDLELQALPDGVGEFFYRQYLLRLKDDARVLAVPTGDEDAESRRARLAGYLELSMNVANFAALFVPVLGEMMMVVAGAQLLTETFQGIDAWRHGDMDEALEHLTSVAENVAMVAVFAAAAKVAAPDSVPAIEGSSFVGEMIPVKCQDGSVRLWKPDLAPFNTRVALPDGLKPTADGVFTHKGQHYIPIEGTFYRVELDPVLNKWRIQSPRSPEFSPTLEHNGAGAWRHEGESPLSWDANTAFKRLGYSVQSLPEASIEQVMAVTGTDESQLRNLHLGNQKPSPALIDTLEHFDSDQQVQTFCEQLNDSSRFESANPQLQAELLPLLPGWPTDHSIASSDAQIAEGKLLKAVLEGLSDSDKLAIFGPGKPPTPMNLAAKLGELSNERMPLLFDLLNKARDISSDPLVNLIKRDFPGLSTAAAKELLAEADATQIAQMSTSKRIPLSLSGRARGYLQEARLNRALEGFYLTTGASNPDTQTLALHLLEHLPSWPADLRIEIRQDHFTGELVDSIGGTSSTERAVLIKRGTSYRACDVNGNQLQHLDDSGGFFSAVLQVVPEGSRKVMGFPDALADGQKLRSRVVDIATGQRAVASKVLGQWQIKPGFNGPVRLADGRLGYPLSGRGEASAVRLQPSTEELIAAWQALYPEAPDVPRHIQGLMSRGTSAQALMDLVQTRGQQFETLRSTFDAWVETAGQTPLTDEVRAARRTVATAVGRAWRYADLRSPLGSGNLLLESIDLAAVGDLPSLPELYADLQYLTLRNITADTAQLNTFLARFPQLNRLELVGGGISVIPEGLTELTRLEHLSLENLGLTIDQPAMDLFMNIPRLDELDLSGNVLGQIDSVDNLDLSMVWLCDMGLTDWPEWLDRLNLSQIDISRNQMTSLPDEIIHNRVDHSRQTVVMAYGNPIDHADLEAYWRNSGYGMHYDLDFDFPEEISRLPNRGDAGDDSSNSSSDEEPAPPVATAAIWQVQNRVELNTRLLTAWDQVEAAGDAPNLLILLQRLRETPDFKTFHEQLANDVLVVLEAAAGDTQLRGQLEGMANDRLFGADQTCQDGARLIFSDVQVAVYAEQALRGVPEARQTSTLLGVLRSLFRLAEVERIADLEITRRESAGTSVDHAEVRMAYRMGLARELGLPGQPTSMVWWRLAAVDREALLDARRLVLQREMGPEFIDYVLQDQRWSERLRAGHRAELERTAAPFRAQMAALEAHPPVDQIEDLRRRAALYERMNVAHEANDRQALV